MGDLTILGLTSGSGEADGVPTKATRRSLGPGANQAAPGDRVPGVFPTAKTAAGIAAALASVSTTDTLELVGSYVLNAPASIPAWVHVKARAGTTLTKTGSGALTLYSFEAPRGQVFFGFSPGDVRFGPGFHGAICPEWWGAKADFDGASGHGTDCTDAFRCAVAACYDPQPEMPTPAWPGHSTPYIQLGAGKYRITGSIACMVAERGVSICGQGPMQTGVWVDGTTSTDGLTFTRGTQYGQGGALRDLSINACKPWPSDEGFEAGNAKSRDLLTVGNMNAFEAQNVNLNYGGRRALTCYGNIWTTFRGVRGNACGERTAFIGHETFDSENPPTLGTTTFFYDCSFDDASTHSAEIGWYQLNTTFVNTTFETAGRSGEGSGLYVRDGSVTLISPHFESCAGHEFWCGHDASPEGMTPAGCRILMANPVFAPGARGPGAQKAGAYFENAVGSVVVGGVYGSIWYSVLIGPTAEVEFVGWPGNEALSPGAQPYLTNSAGVVTTPMVLGELTINASVGEESGHARTITCAIQDAHGVHIPEARQVEIVAYPVTDGQGDMYMGDLGTQIAIYNRLTAPTTLLVTTTAYDSGTGAQGGRFKFTVADRTAETLTLKISATGCKPLVLPLSFAG